MGFLYTTFPNAPARPPASTFDQSLIAHTYFCSGDIKQMICCSLFPSPSSISSASVALPSTQLGEVSERIRDGLLSVFLKKCPFQFYQSWSERYLCMITSDEKISSPHLVCKQNSLYLHSLCVDILFNSLPREITDVTSDVSTCKGYPWATKSLFPLQRLSLGIPMKIPMIEKQKARTGRWEDGKGGFSFHFPLNPTRFHFPLSPASLRHKEASEEDSV